MTIAHRNKTLPSVSLVFGFILFVIRTKTTVELDPIVNAYDSASYFDFKLIGGVRMPLITFIFSSLESYESISLFLSVFSSLSWLALSQVIFLLKINRYLIFICSITLLSLGFSNQVFLLDGFIGSQSLDISTLVFCLSSIFLVFLKRNLLSYTLFLTCVSATVGVKSINAILAIFILFCFILFLYLNNDLKRKTGLFMYVSCGVLMSIFFYSFTKVNVIPLLNTSALINQRIWNVDSWRTFTLNEGFPQEARSTYVKFASNNLGLPADTAVSINPSYKKWYFDGGENFLIKFMLNHPGYTVFGPIAFPIFDKDRNLKSTIWGAAATGIVDYEIQSGQWFKAWPNNYFFWPTDRAWGYAQLSLFLTIIFVSFLPNLNSRQKMNDLQKINLVFLVLGLIAGYLSWWFGSMPSDIDRHQFSFSVTIRIVFILSVLYLGHLLLEKLKNKRFKSNH